MLPTPESSIGTASPKSPEKQSSQQEIARQLEQSILDDMQAVNERNWGADSPLFRRKAQYWEAEATAALSLKKMSCQQFVAAVKRITETRPDYKVRAIDFTTTVDEDAGRAEVFANVETSGLWEGVSQRNVTLCEYHRIDGVWYHVAHRTFTGMEPGTAIS